MTLRLITKIPGDPCHLMFVALGFQNFHEASTTQLAVFNARVEPGWLRLRASKLGAKLLNSISFVIIKLQVALVLLRIAFFLLCVALGHLRVAIVLWRIVIVLHNVS